MTTVQTTSICRFCFAGCPLTVTLEDGRPVSVAGNKASPSYAGYCCTRGQSMPDLESHPDRLLHSLRRRPDGIHEKIDSDVMMDEIAEQVQQLVAQHGPGSVAIYFGTMCGAYPLASTFAASWVTALGSPMVFSSMTIDQPGKLIAAALIGGWEAGPQTFDDADVWMIVGGNPLVTIGGALPVPNTPRRLTEALKRGMKLIVIDPRKTETARRADIHLQVLPGHDAAIFAAMIKIVITERLYDSAFVAENVSGFEALRDAVEAIDPARVSAAAGIAAEDLFAAARMFASAGRGLANGATGANMSGRSTLTEYLIQSLNVLCGRYLRAGEPISNPGVLLPRALPRAQPRSPIPANDPSKSMSSRGLTGSVAGMPTAALADEILSGKIKALFSVGGNPVVAFPDQDRTIAALSALELFVQVDVRMTPSAQLAHYVMAPKIAFEVPTCSYGPESLELYVGSWGLPEPFGMYAAKLTDPPVGSDVIEEWEFFWGLARRQGLQLKMYDGPSFTGARREPRPTADIPMDAKPTTDEMLALLTRGSRIPLDELKRHPDGALFDETVLTEPKAENCDARLQVADRGMLAELADLVEAVEQDATGPFHVDHQYVLVSRRAAHLNNSSGQDLPKLVRKGGTHNPVFLHPDDLAALGLGAGAEVEIVSAHGAIPAIAEVDSAMRPGVISMTHAYGRLPSEKADFRQHGSNTGRLLSVEDNFDRYSGIPQMSAVPVSIRPLAAA